MVQEQDRDAGSNLIITLSDQYDANSNRLSETESRPGNSDRVTAYTYDKANRLITTSDPNNNKTTYAYDAVGNQTGVTDPGGYTTSVTPNAVNLPVTTTHRDPSQNVIANTTNTYDNRNVLQQVVTTDSPNSLTLTATLNYNSNDYLSTDNISHQGTLVTRSLTSTLNYQSDNLLKTILQQGQPNRDEYYDGAGRLICSDSFAKQYLEYDGSGRRTKRYWNEYGPAPCSQIIANPDGNVSYKRATYSYDGNRLIAVDARGCGSGVCNPNTFYSRTLTYDAEGNLTQVNHIDYAGGGTAYTLSYSWETDTHRMTSVTRTMSSSVTYTATLEYDRQNRITRFCQSAGCDTFGYVGASDWLSSIRNQFGSVTQQYLYANGRPLRAIIAGATSYFRYNWHGDAIWVGTNGDDRGGSWPDYGAWGDGYNFGAGYYHWNGAWGYLKFPDNFNINLNDGVDIGLYYVHGRWYNQDTGLFLSPDETGDYFYGGAGQDPVNYSWLTRAATPGGGGRGMPIDLLLGIEAHLIIQGWCVFTYDGRCQTEVWTGNGFADIVLYPFNEVYEIKPYTQYGFLTGPDQLAKYLRALGPRYVEGTTWKPNATIGLPDGKVLEVFTRYDTYPGIIFYTWAQRIPVYFPQRVPGLIPILQPAPVPIPVMPAPAPVPVPIPLVP